MMLSVKMKICNNHFVNFIFVICLVSHEQLALKTQGKCEKVTIPMCRDLPYNMTRIPNLMGHTNQNDAAIEVHEYMSLVKYGCSQHLKFFLCSLYAPMCAHQVDVPIPSCRSVCEEVKGRCLPVLQTFGFNWPLMLNCSRLPVPEKNGLCMELPDIAEERRSRLTESERELKVDIDRDTNKSMEPSLLSSLLYPGTHRKGIPHNDILVSPGQNGKLDQNMTKKMCPKNFVLVPSKTTSFEECTPRCDRDVLFTRHDKNVVEVWIVVWSVICFIANILTVTTFCIDTHRFRYPERPIIFLSMCYCITSTAYLVRIFAGAEFVSCERTNNGELYLVKEGLENMGCITVFLLLYYFGMAAALWWLVLTCTWFLSAGRKWGQEAIESRASYFHILAWGVPAILTIAILILREVEGDELTGLCNVGSRSPDGLLRFVILPISSFFFMGSVFIVLGFSSLVRIRKVMKQGERNISKLERFMVRIGTFSILYTVPSGVVIACLTYEYFNRPGWYAVAMGTVDECDLSVIGHCSLKQSIPNQNVFMLKHAMKLLLGIATGVWVWNSKTWKTWAAFCHNWFRRKPRRDFKSSTIVYHPPHVASFKASSNTKSLYLPVHV